MLYIDSQSTRLPKLVVPRSPCATHVGRDGGTDGLPQSLRPGPVHSLAPLTDRVEAAGGQESLKLTPFGGPNNEPDSVKPTGTQPSFSEVLTFFKEGTDSTPPPSLPPGTGLALALRPGARKPAKEDLPPIATILDTLVGPVRTHPRRATPSVRPYQRPAAKDTAKAKVNSGGDLLHFLATVTTTSTNSDGSSTEVDFTFDDDEEEVDQLDSDSESEAESSTASMSTAVAYRSEVREEKAFIDLSDEDDTAETPPSPLDTSPPGPIKAIPSDLTRRFLPIFPWEFYACDISLGLSLYDAECSRLQSTGSYSRAAARLLISHIFDGANPTLGTFKTRREEIETERGRRVMERFARMGRRSEACFLNYLRAVRGNQWYKPSQLSSVNRKLRDPEVNII